MKQKNKHKLPNLTENDVENIRIMAPYLSGAEQKNVFYLMMGLLGGEVPEQKEGDKNEIPKANNEKD